MHRSIGWIVESWPCHCWFKQQLVLHSSPLLGHHGVPPRRPLQQSMRYSTTSTTARRSRSSATLVTLLPLRERPQFHGLWQKLLKLFTKDQRNTIWVSLWYKWECNRARKQGRPPAIECIACHLNSFVFLIASCCMWIRPSGQQIQGVRPACEIVFYYACPACRSKHLHVIRPNGRRIRSMQSAWEFVVFYLRMCDMQEQTLACNSSRGAVNSKHAWANICM